MMYFPFIVLSATTVSLVSGYPIDGNGVNCRAGPGTNFPVVKTYNQGSEVSVTCQAGGTDINGDELWDKTSDGCYVADYYVKTGTSNYVTAHCDGSSGGGSGGSSGGNLPGLDSTQNSHAHAIIGQVKKENLGRQGCIAGITTALVETGIRILANDAVPESLKYPHDGMGSDHDSVGIFQQRAMYYPNIAADMDAAQSAEQFFAKMKAIKGWNTMDVGTLCQEVQGSAFPARYPEQVSKAEKICAAGGL